MAKSSIHIEGGNFNFFKHNDRTRPTKNSIFSDEKNKCWNDSETAYRIWKSEVEKRAKKYTERTGRKLHKNTLTHLSAIVNLNAHHKIQDLKPVVVYIEREFGAKVVQVAIHRDEGHISPKGEAVKNYHAHIEMVGLDEQGNSVRRKLDRKALIKLQSEVAKILGMGRGTNYAKEKKPRPKRLDTYEFKEAKKMEEKAYKRIAKLADAKIKDINEENKKLRKQLKAAKAGREQYAELEAEVKNFKELAKNKQLTKDDMEESFKELGERLLKELEEAKRTVKEQKQAIERAESVQNELKGDLDRAEVVLKQKDAQIANLNETVEIQDEIIKSQAKEIGTLRKVVEKVQGWANWIKRTLSLDIFEDNPPADDVQQKQEEDIDRKAIGEKVEELRTLAALYWTDDIERHFGLSPIFDNPTNEELQALKEDKANRLAEEIRAQLTPPQRQDPKPETHIEIPSILTPDPEITGKPTRRKKKKKSRGMGL